MADDASGTDGDDRREASPTDPDGRQSNGERTDATTSDARNRSDRSLRDERIGSDDGARSRRGDDEYRVPLDLSGGSEADATEPGADDGDEDDPYGPEPSSTPIEPGDPELEHALFVFLGAVAMAVVIYRLVGVPM